MILYRLMKFAGRMCQVYPVLIVPIDRRIEHSILVSWNKDYDGEGPEYEYDADLDQWEPFYFIPIEKLTIYSKTSDETKVLDLKSEDWVIDKESIKNVQQQLKLIHKAVDAVIEDLGSN